MCVCEDAAKEGLRTVRLTKMSVSQMLTELPLEEQTRNTEAERKGNVDTALCLNHIIYARGVIALYLVCV